MVSKFKSNDKGPTYQFAQVEKGEITQMVSETGEVMSTNLTPVETTITGVVKDVKVKNGDRVLKNQDLFYVVSSATQQERAKAYADYLSAKNNLDSANRSTLSLESLMWSAHEKFEGDSLDKDLSVDDPIFIQTNRDWLAAEQKYKDQKNVVAQAQSSLLASWQAYQATVDGPIKATVDGTVENIAIAVGQAVKNKDQAMVITSEADTWVKVAINESDRVQLQPDQTAVATIDALDQEVDGNLTRVDEIGTVVSDVVVFYAYIKLNDSPVMLKPGMTAQVDIFTQQKKDILLVPNSAIKPYQGEKAVQVLDDATGEIIYLPIKTGIVGDVNTEVLSGVDEGQKIIVSGGKSTNSNSGGMSFRPPVN